MPNATEKEVRDYATNPDIVVLENSSIAQAAKETISAEDITITGINFWEDKEHTVDGITCDKKASFMMIEDDDGVRIAVSDPTWKNEVGIQFEITRQFGELISKDGGITILRNTGSALTFTVKTQSAITQGKTFTLKFKHAH
jgi:hyaluronate lyase